MELQELRERIDDIDEELLSVFAERMKVSAEIARVKREQGLPVRDAARERQILAEIGEKTEGELREYAMTLFSSLFDLSSGYQSVLLDGDTSLTDEIRRAIEKTPPLFPESAAVACQGVEGAYSQLACERLFRAPNVLWFDDFEAVFTAVAKGLCRYGVVPLENSAAGSVNRVYDLMTKGGFRVVRAVRLKVDHSLLANPGADLGGLREIYSHEQAISQCGDFLRRFPEVKVIPCANTAAAAKMVAESGRTDVAALSSRACAALYGLCRLADSVQDRDNNYTRFICVAKELEIYPGADKTSLMLTLPHRPGALYKVLSRLYVLGINLIKLESRPIPDRDFEFMFYFDLETSVYSPRFLRLMREIRRDCETFAYLGSYSEVI
ncbi:MAG: bifunctional chorismate mutase/prephenate dehydratase [Bacillota bacterium]|jgi:chorismate mutase/prephenate dehydratase